MINPLVKTVDLRGKGREAQEEAQALVISEFMDTNVHPNYRLMVNYATGVGKAKAAIETAMKFYDTVSQGQLFIGCFRETQRDQVWAVQLAKWGRLHPIMANNRRECYASFQNIKGHHFGLVILDEFQHVTELTYTFFEQNTFDGILILTATEPKDMLKKVLIRRLTYGRRLVIKADAAIEAEIINDFEVSVMMLKMDDTEKFKLIANSNTLYTERTGYLKKCALLQDAKHSGNAIRIKFAAIERMRYLGNTQTKTRAAAYVQDEFRSRGHRFITVAASIAQTSKLSIYTYHSKTTDRWYKDFLHNKINELVSVNMIREGENFENLGRCLLVQADSNANNFVQLAGRTLRLPPGQVSRIILLCIKDTQDETIVQKALSDTNPDKIKYIELDRERYWPLKDHLQL